jgi:type I restriction enzyme S subunit
MIADLKPYPEYKAMAQAWVGDVPRHWSVLPSRALFSEVKDRNHPDEEMLSVTIARGIVRQKALLAGSSKKDASNLDKSAYKLVQPRDIAYNKMRAWQGAIGVSDLRGIISPAYVVMRLREDDNLPRYFHHLYRTPQFAKEAERWSYGITSDMWSLRPEHFKMIYTPEPPPTEQVAIVRFLDWANGRLERAIRAKRKVIALLNEQKQAIINRAVTRGLDPSVPLKPSGIPWLDEIPQHWSLKRFKFLATINSGQVDPRKAECRDLVLIAPNHIQSGSGRLLEQETADEQGADSGKYLVNRGQVIYSKIRPNLRKATIAPCDCLCSADMYPIAPTTGELSTDYLLRLLLSQPFTKFAVDTSMRVAMPKINREALANCLMWYPGPQEQSQILGFIAREGAPLDTANSRLEREIELLREYRTRLVADVVTGKLDVREAAALLPDEAAPDTAEDDADLSGEIEAADEETSL